MVPETLGTTDSFLSFWAISCQFTLLTTQKTKLKKNEKTTWNYYHFTLVYHKWHSYNVWFLNYGAWQIEFCAISNHFLPFYPTNNLKNQNFEKIKKKAWRYHHFTLVYHKWQSYDVWCIVPETYSRQTGFFLILDHFVSMWDSQEFLVRFLIYVELRF